MLAQKEKINTGPLHKKNDYTATMLVNGFTASDDFTISYYYSTGGSRMVAITTYFGATEIPAVPLPAGGVLLLSAVAAGLGVSRLRSKETLKAA